MGTLKWYKRDPRAAITGMLGMTNEEVGAYNRILDLIYCNDGALPDNPEYICDVLNCDVRVWRRLKARLLDLGKIYVRGGDLRNERADAECLAAQHRYLVAIKSADKRWATYRQIKDLGDGSAMLSTTTYRKNLSARLVPIPKTTDKKDN